MIPRLLQLPDDASFFIFGARATGKTTFLKSLPWFKNALYINLLMANEERRFAQDPDELANVVRALPDKTTHIIIDEVQKLPKLLDIVHELIETTDKYFVLTGSSARKLKHGGANLLAGRAFVYYLFPFSYLELKEKFSLSQSLQWGLLPKVLEYKNAGRKQHYLEAYTNTYLKEEIWAEQFIKHLDPFRHFLEVAAQTNGKLVNFTNIARDVGVDVKTVQKYFSILEDTLIGFFLNPFQHSFRKRLSKAPKFYFFDPGVVRALSACLSVSLTKSTSVYGDVFEHFIILECMKLASYFSLEFRFSYLQTKDGAEIDLVVERPGLPILLIEIKSNENVRESDLSTYASLIKDLKNCEAVCFSQDKYRKKYGRITIFPWQEGIRAFFCSHRNGGSTDL